MSLYERLCEAREIVLVQDTSSLSRDERMKVLSQLMILAFNNRQKPDELPKVFRIQNVDFPSSRVLDSFLLFKVRINAKKVTLVNSDHIRGNTFEIELF